MGYSPVDLDLYHGREAAPLPSIEQQLQLEADSPGPFLRTWIEFQVDARVNQALRDLIEGQVLNTTADGHEHTFSLERQRAIEHCSRTPLTERLPPRGQLEVARLEAEAALVQEEVRSVAQNQAKLLKVVEDMSNEVAHLGTQSTCRKLEVDELARTVQQLDKPRIQVEELARTVQQLDSKLSVWRTEVATDVRSSSMRDKGESESLRLEAQAAVAARVDFEGRLEELRLELSKVTRYWFDFERRVDKNQREITERVEAWTSGWEDGLKQELNSREHNLSRELHLEMSAEMKKQQEAVFALDEQLWLTDKRLGARINELLQFAAESLPDGSRSNLLPTSAEAGNGMHEVGRRGAARNLLAAAAEAMEDNTTADLRVKGRSHKAWRGRLATGADEYVVSPRATGRARLAMPPSLDRGSLPLRSHRGALLAMEGLAEALLDQTSEP